MDFGLCLHSPKIVLLGLLWQLARAVALPASIQSIELNSFPDPNENDVMVEKLKWEIGENQRISRNAGELPEYDGGTLDYGAASPDPIGHSYLEWCEEGRRKRISPSKCQEVTFAPPFPTCICVNGVVSLQFDETHNCQTRIHFARGECFKFSAFGHGGVRSLRFVCQQGFHHTDFIVATEERGTWTVTCPGKEHPGLLIRGNVGIHNGQLFQDGQGNNCIQKLNSERVHLYRHIFGEYNASGENCAGSAITDSRFVHETALHSPGNHSADSPELCSITCPAYVAGSSLELPDESDILSGTGGVCRPIAEELKTLHKDLNARILRRSIEAAFQKPRSNASSSRPTRSFRLLSLLGDITKKACDHAGIVDSLLLSNAVDLFQVAHEGRGYIFHEDFSNSDFQRISDILLKCLSGIKPIPFRRRDGCDGKVLEVFNTTSYEPVTLSEENEYFEHHIVLDIPWATVDLVHVVCMDHFQHNYRMYHQLEQGMEKLYTNELRTFWMYPVPTPNLNERLFGPNWARQVRNLRLCVKGAYMNAGKATYPLTRPTWLRGSRIRTRAHGVCHGRSANDQSKILSSTYQIYCDPLQFCQR